MMLQIINDGFSAGMSGADVSLVKYIIWGLGVVITSLVTALSILYRGWSKTISDNVDHRQKMAEQMMAVVSNNSVALKEVVVALDHQRSALDKIEKLIIDRIK